MQSVHFTWLKIAFTGYLFRLLPCSATQNHALTKPLRCSGEVARKVIAEGVQVIASHETLLTPREVERDFRIPGRTQRDWRNADLTFRATSLRIGGKRVLFDRASFEEWLEMQRQR